MVSGVHPGFYYNFWRVLSAGYVLSGYSPFGKRAELCDPVAKLATEYKLSIYAVFGIVACVVIHQEVICMVAGGTGKIGVFRQGREAGDFTF